MKQRNLRKLRGPANETVLGGRDPCRIWAGATAVTMMLFASTLCRWQPVRIAREESELRLLAVSAAMTRSTEAKQAVYQITKSLGPVDGVGPSSGAGTPIVLPVQTKNVTASIGEQMSAATKEQPYGNSLGMRFVPVPTTKVLFSVWETRVKDFEAFVEATKYDATGEMYSLDDKKNGRRWGEHGRTLDLRRRRSTRVRSQLERCDGLLRVADRAGSQSGTARHEPKLPVAE